VVDLFSGAGGMSAGFQRHGRFRIIGAVDLEIGKPSNGHRTLQCNRTYERNIGVAPIAADLATLEPKELLTTLRRRLGGRWNGKLDVLISCAPCTGFSRVNASNHIEDDPRNSLVGRSALFVAALKPRVFLMENARELIMGRFRHHYETLRKRLEEIGYRASGEIHFLNQFGLPQSRERALVVAVRDDLPLHTLTDLWEGWSVRQDAVTVRRAIGSLPPLEAGGADPSDPMHACPSFASKTSYDRMVAMPADGGDWASLLDHPEAERLLTPAMKRTAARGDFGSHPDVYGRLWWDRPAVTIKRECSHHGNGRYSHPEQHRLLSVREMAILQGFPRDYVFEASGLSDMYRHIGDAVPPLISYQLARLVEWIFTDDKPSVGQLMLPKTHISAEDIVKAPAPRQFELAIT
jgi:DNA (cytosine-5)-methyltransferase 1